MFKKTTFLVLCLILPSLFFAQTSKELDLKLIKQTLPFELSSFRSEYNPRVALALSGGGARGIAQLGVLKALTESGIEFNQIIGTSMGSIVGGLYAAGYSLNELDSLVITAPWIDFFSLEETNRRELFLDQKVTEDKAIFAIRLDGFEPVIPTAINTGQRVSNYLNLLSLNAPLNTVYSFDEFLYPFKAVSTNLVTGEPYVLSKGTLGAAMRASSSVSLVLEPVRVDSLILVDGGLVANVPVEIASQTNADYIVAVDVTSPLRTSEELKYPWEIADQLVSIPMRLINDEHLKNADVIIRPDINHRKNNDFTELRKLIDSGYHSTKEPAKILKENLESLTLSKIDIDEVMYSNLEIVCANDDLKNYLDEQIIDEQKISEKELIKIIINYPALDDFKSLSAEIDSLSSKLIIIFEENPVVENIIITGAKLIDADSVVAKSINLRGKPFNSKKILETFLNILRHYRAEGYSLVRIEDYLFEDNVLRINVDEQTIDKLIVHGNEKTNDEIILRELPFSQGDIFVRREVEQGLTNLRSTGLFENIELRIEQKENQNVLTVEVKEKPSLLFRFGLRLDNEYFTQPSFDIREENFLGTGTELGAIFTGGIRNQFAALELRANRIFNTYFTYKIQAFYNSVDINTYIDDSTSTEKRFVRTKLGEYSQSNFGGSIGIGTQFQKFGNIIVEARYQQDNIKAIEGFAISDEYTTNIAALKFELSIDSQNKYPFPTEGIYFNGFYETAQTAFGGDIGYSKLYLDYNSYFDFTDDHNINLRMKFGYGDETLPLSQQFSFGGQNSFFGYREYEYRGRQILISSLEYRYKLPVKFFFDTYFKARYDLGSIWAQQENIRFKDLRHGIGGTIAIDTPIGPAEFSVGRSFLIKNALPKNVLSWGETHFYFTIGYYY